MSKSSSLESLVELIRASISGTPCFPLASNVGLQSDEPAVCFTCSLICCSQLKASMISIPCGFARIITVDTMHFFSCVLAFPLPQAQVVDWPPLPHLSVCYVAESRWGCDCLCRQEFNVCGKQLVKVVNPTFTQLEE